MKTTLVLAALATLLVAASAYCPNLCSGHGSCGSGDTCTCYTARGTDGGGVASPGNRAAWTGPDCSLRTCPLATSFTGASAVGLTNVAPVINTPATYWFETQGSGHFGTNHMNTLKRGTELRVFPTSGSDAGFTVTLYAVSAGGSADVYQVTTYEALPESIDTTWSVAYPIYENDAVNTDANPNTGQGVHNRVECAGQGTCNRVTGNCECFPGYEGEACTRTSCPGDCSGHGVCLSLNRLASDAKTAYEGTSAADTGISVYDGWDSQKEYGCLCDVGFRGPACDMVECPSAADPMLGCGGGPCNGCTSSGCGIKDPMQTTVDNSNAVPSFTYSNCALVSKCVGNEQRDCSGRGLCDYTTGQCMCFSGFYGEACHIQTILV